MMWKYLAAFALAGACMNASAVDATQTRIGSTQTTAPVANQTNEAARQLAELTAEGRMWGLSTEEMVRAHDLMRFREAFTNIHLSPVEVLGVHARSDAERKRYAELFARILHDDTVRVLAFQVAHTAAMAKMYPNEQVLDLPKGALPRSFFGAGQ